MESVTWIITLEVTSEDLNSTIENLTKSTNIVVSGTLTSDDILNVKSKLTTLYENHAEIKIGLDLSSVEGVTSIPEYGFSDCANLVSIILPESITEIGQFAFNNCSNLTYIDIPDAVTVIPRYAFYAAGLTSIDFPSNLKTIGENCFGGSCDFTEISLPEGTETIEYGVFYGMSNLTTLNIPASLQSIANGAFDYCNITSLSVAEGSKYFKIVDNMLLSKGNDTLVLSFNKQSIEEVEVPNGVTKIFNHVFRGCSNLQTLTLPASLESIGNEIINLCYSLETVNFRGTTEQKNSLIQGLGNDDRLKQISDSWVCDYND